MRRRTSCLLAALLLAAVTGCAGEGEATPSEPSTSAASSASSAPESSAAASPSDETEKVVEISVAVTDGTVRPKPRRVEVDRDSQVRLLVTIDVDDTLHVHGFDIEEPLEAGRTTTVELVADQSGIFEVETHESGLELLQLEVR
ncbi:MAG TPA: hypothetical protein VF423_07190 [Actinomycetes bacterium]